MWKPNKIWIPETWQSAQQLLIRIPGPGRPRLFCVSVFSKLIRKVSAVSVKVFTKVSSVCDDTYLNPSILSP